MLHLRERCAGLVVGQEHAQHARRALEVRDLLPRDLRGDRPVVLLDARLRLGGEAEPVEVLEVREHGVAVDPVVDETRDLIDADRLAALDHLHRALGRAE